MLDHVGRGESAGRIRNAMFLNSDGVRTPDLGGKASTTDFAQGIVRRLNLSGLTGTGSALQT